MSVVWIRKDFLKPYKNEGPKIRSKEAEGVAQGGETTWSVTPNSRNGSRSGVGGTRKSTMGVHARTTGVKEKMRRQGATLPVQALGYVISTKAICRLAFGTEACSPYSGGASGIEVCP